MGSDISSLAFPFERYLRDVALGMPLSDRGVVQAESKAKSACSLSGTKTRMDRKRTLLPRVKTYGCPFGGGTLLIYGCDFDQTPMNLINIC